MQLLGRQYRMTLVSDVAGNATLLELDDVSVSPRDTVGDVRYDDATGDMTLSLYRRDVPLAAVEWLLAEARRRLPPVVAIVVDPAYGGQLADVAARVPVWVADTPENRAAATRLRADTTGAIHEVTTFRVSPDDGPARWCAEVLPAVMDHHAGAGPHPRAGVLEIIGTPLDAPLTEALASYGFTRLEPTERGARACLA